MDSILTMLSLAHLLKNFLELFEPQRDRDECFLAQSADLCDLERRIRAIDERGRAPDTGIALGLYAR